MIRVTEICCIVFVFKFQHEISAPVCELSVVFRLLNPLLSALLHPNCPIDTSRGLSRPQAQLSRSTFALHYVWILECPVRENREICDVDGHIWRFGQRPRVCPVGSWGCRSYPGKVFGEKSRGPASDAHQIARYRAWIQRNRRSGPKLIKILILGKILTFS